VPQCKCNDAFSLLVGVGWHHYLLLVNALNERKPNIWLTSLI